MKPARILSVFNLLKRVGFVVLFRAKVKCLLQLFLFFVILVPVKSARCQPGINPIWEQRIGGTGDQGAADIQVCLNGGYIIVGSSRPTDVNPLDIYAVRLQSNGDTLWTRTYANTNTGTSVVQTPDSNFVIVGAGSTRCILKVNDSGDTLWTRSYRFAGSQDGVDVFSVRVTDDGGLVLVGSRQVGPPNWVDVAVVRTDTNGDTLWTRSYGFGQSNTDEGFDIWQTADQGFVVVGSTTTDSPTFDSHPLVFRLTASGDTVWSRVLDSSGKFLSVAGLSATTFFASGEYYPNNDSVHAYISKFTLAGSFLWTRSYTAETLPQRFTDVRLSSDGNLILAGGTPGSLMPHCYLTKVNTSGDTLWTRVYGGDDIASGAAVCEILNGYVIAGAVSEDWWEHQDVYILCTGPELSADPPNIISTQFELLSVFPNPFNSTLSISLDVPLHQEVSLSLYDLLGREVDVIYRGRVASNTISYVAPSSLSSGVYFLRAVSAHDAVMQKVMLLK